MNAWLDAHWMHIAAMICGVVLRWGALQFMGNATGKSRGGAAQGGAPGDGKTKGRVIKYITLFFMVVAGLLLAFGAYPIAQWLIGWGTGLAGWISVVFGVATLWAGWHALHGLVALVHDMVDGTPDKEAFTAAFWVPTTLPLGWAALSELFTNPRGVANGLACLAVSIVSAIYAHKILGKTHKAQGHYGIWMYLSTVICIFVGIAHIPALIYANSWIGGHLPEWAAWLLRVGMLLAGVVFFMIGLGDWLRDRIPEKWSQWAAMYTIPTFTVLSVSAATLQADAGTSLNTIFGAFS